MINICDKYFNQKINFLIILFSNILIKNMKFFINLALTNHNLYIEI